MYKLARNVSSRKLCHEHQITRQFFRINLIHYNFNTETLPAFLGPFHVGMICIVLATYAISTSGLSNSGLSNCEDLVKPWNEIPGPLSLPIIGQLLHFLPGGWLYKRNIELQELLYKNYGPIVRLDGNYGLHAITFIFDPEAAFNLFRKKEALPLRSAFDSLIYYKKNIYNKNIDDPIGLILDQGQIWKTLRSTVNPIMLQPNTVKLYTNAMAEVAEDMIKRMRYLRNKENMMENNIFMELNLWSLESIGVVALGNRLNCFDPNLPDDSPSRKLVQIVHGLLGSLEKLDFQPSLWKYFETPDFIKGMKIYEENMKINEYFINKAEEQLQVKEKTNDEDRSILEKLLQIDRKIAYVIANDMLIAGIDTVASTVLGFLYLMAVNPEKQKILRNEILLKEDKHPYLKACIKETLRIFPVVSGNFRTTTKEHDVLGYKIPKDMTVIAGNQTFCAMEEQFVRPTEFIPERWIVDKSDPLYYGNAHPFAYAPFGFGVRSCIGRRIAELEMETFITKVIENFQVEWYGPPPKRDRHATINYFKEPYYFIFRDI